MPAELDMVRSVGPYEGWIRGAIIQYKYHGEWDRTAMLATYLMAVMDDLLPCDAVVPVPLHPSRMRQRGFNQAARLAQHVATMLGLRMSEPLVRSRRTNPQVALDAAQRSANVSGAFDILPGWDVSGLSIVLIDDVITTGSTLAACAEALRYSGARSVSVATIAREL